MNWFLRWAGDESEDCLYLNVFGKSSFNLQFLYLPFITVKHNKQDCVTRRVGLFWMYRQVQAEQDWLQVTVILLSLKKTEEESNGYVVLKWHINRTAGGGGGGRCTTCHHCF
jgi:hypothetical protein